MKSSFISRISLLFKFWSCYLVFVYLPYELIFWIDSYRLSLTPLEITVNISALILVMLFLAVFIALFADISSLLLKLTSKLFSKNRNSVATEHGNTFFITHYLLLFLSCYLFSKHFLFWANIYRYEIHALLLALLLTTIIVWRNRSTFREKSFHLVQVLTRRALVPICICSLILSTWSVIKSLGNHDERSQTIRVDKEASKGKPDIILITFDALAAEDMSLYGYRLNTTPNIDAFARECEVFDMAIAGANWTRTSVASMLTGKYPDKHLLINSGLSGNVNLFPVENLPAILKSKDYRTVSLNANWDFAQPIATGTAEFFDINKFDFVASENIGTLKYLPKFITLNYHNTAYKTGIKSIYWLTEYLFGFDSYWYNKALSLLPKNTRPFYPPKLIFDSATEILGNTKSSSSQPVFLWIHLLVPHSPYLPDKPFMGAFSHGSKELAGFESPNDFHSRAYSQTEQPYIDQLRLHYNENLLYADDALGSFLSTLKQSGRLDDSIVIISADHGESFSHGWQGHGGSQLYQPLIHIPLLIHLPGQKTGTRISTTVSQADVAPTILDLLDYTVPSYMNGRSLVRAFGDKNFDDMPVFAMNLDGNPIRGKITKGNVAVVYGGYKYINSGELYKLDDDPGENSNLAALEPERAEMMSRLILDRLAASGNIVQGTRP